MENKQSSMHYLTRLAVGFAMVLLMMVSLMPMKAKAAATPLTFTSLEDGSTVQLYSGISASYSKNGGSWNTYSYGTTITINNGDTVSLKGTAAGTVSDSSHHFNITGKVKVSGDINSLTNEVGGDIALVAWHYSSLFKNCEGLVDARDLQLPSTSLDSRAYQSMFEGCTKLVSAPSELPVAPLAGKGSVYYCMFKNCESLINPPVLHLSSGFGGGNFTSMFEGCSSLYVEEVTSGETWTIDGSVTDMVKDTAPGGVSAIVGGKKYRAGERLSGTARISGVVKYNQILTASLSADSNNTGTLSYQWKRDDVNISGATSSTYTLGQSDIGHGISVTIRSDVETGSITSSKTANVAKADGPAAPTTLTGVACTVTSNDDGKITGTTTDMEYSTVSTFASGVYDCTDTETTGLAAGTYYVRVKATDTMTAGAYATVTIDAVVTYTVTFNANGHGTAPAALADVVSGSKISAPTAPSATGYTFGGWYKESGCTNAWDFASDTVTADKTLYAKWTPAALAGTVSISGTAKYGQTLTAVTTGLTNNTGTLSYQWKSGGTNVGTNSSAYTIRTADIGKTITVEVRSSVQTGFVSSTATAAVTKADQTIDAPTLSTKTDTGVTVTALTGYGDTKYGYSTTDTVPASWSTGNVFTGLAPNTTYYFFAKFEGNENYNAVTSTGTAITTDAHVHVWGYNASGATLTATCEKNASHTAFLTLSASNATYTGSSVTAGFGAGEAEAWEAMVGTTAPAITYEYKATADGTYAAVTETKKAGYYRANVTADGKTASVVFAINKADQTIDVPSLSAKTETSVTLTALTGNGETKYGYNTTNTEPASWSTSNVITGLNRNTTYYFFAKFEGNENYNAITSLGTAIATYDHDFETAWSTDADNHWHACQREGCDAKSGLAAHTPGEAATETADQICTVCGYVIAPATGHLCKNHLTLVPAVAATCTAAGNNAYYICETDGNCFLNSDATGATTVEAQTLAALGHNPAAAWSSDADGHWHACQREGCAVKLDAAAHIPGEAATETTAQTCTVCGHVLVPETGHVCANHLTFVSAVAPTCATGGNNAYYLCSCDKVYLNSDATGETTVAAQTLAPTGHSKGSNAKVAAVAPTCTTDGNVEYWECANGCNTKIADDLSAIANVVVPALGHDFATTLSADADNHWYACQRSGCDAKSGVAAHRPGAAATETTAQLCTDCHYELVPATGHLCKNHLTLVPAVEATCTTAGNHAYYTCETDGNCFLNSDATGATTAEAQIIEALGHDWSDLNGICKRDPSHICEHTGVVGNECPVCGMNHLLGYFYRELDTVPGVIGNITGNALATAETNEFVADIVNASEIGELIGITSTEQAAGVNVWVTITEAASTMADADKEKINDTAGGKTVAMYLDVVLNKKVGAGVAEAVHDLTDTMSVSLVIPVELRRANRVFSMVRVHNGVATVVDSSYDAATYTFTFETDHFSSYGLVYTDIVPSYDPADTGLIETTLTVAKAPQTGESSGSVIWMFVLMTVSVGLAAVIYKNRKRSA